MDENTLSEAFLTKLRQMPRGMKFICMFSGGKDSGLSLARAMQTGYAVALIHILSGTRSLYHEQEKEVIDAQARAMGIPIEYIHYKWWRNQDSAMNLLLRYKAAGVGAVVFGDIRTKYMARGHVPLCEKAGLYPCAPVCACSYDSLMDGIEEHRLHSIITKINHPAIDAQWLGRPFDRQAYAHFRTLGIDAFGELDEFHTTLVDGSCFQRKLSYSPALINEKNLRIEIIG